MVLLVVFFSNSISITAPSDVDTGDGLFSSVVVTGALSSVGVASGDEVVGTLCGSSSVGVASGGEVVGGSCGSCSVGVAIGRDVAAGSCGPSSVGVALLLE